jgi:hypothetical protein
MKVRGYDPTPIRGVMAARVLDVNLPIGLPLRRPGFIADSSAFVIR